MPELPEVETTARLVAPLLEGRTITGTRVQWTNTLGGARPATFRGRVVGARIGRVWRRAKYIVLDLERGARPAGALLVHLRMSARLLVEPTGSKDNPYLRCALSLEDGRELRFVDVRKFGRFTFRAAPEAVLARLGPEPLDEDFTPATFRTLLRGRRRRLKPLLLDQGFLAGLGNIYVDESLHLARLHPERIAAGIPGPRADALHAAIRRVLTRAIKMQGASFDGFYRTPEGRPGAYQEVLRVYGRAGKPCPACAAPVRRLVIAQRGTHVCLRCQRPPGGERLPPAVTVHALRRPGERPVRHIRTRWPDPGPLAGNRSVRAKPAQTR